MTDVDQRAGRIRPLLPMSDTGPRLDDGDDSFDGWVVLVEAAIGGPITVPVVERRPDAYIARLDAPWGGTATILPGDPCHLIDDRGRMRCCMRWPHDLTTKLGPEDFLAITIDRRMVL